MMCGSGSVVQVMEINSLLWHQGDDKSLMVHLHNWIDHMNESLRHDPAIKFF